MRIVERNRDRLVIEDRKTAPPFQPAIAVVLLTLPLLITGAWRVFALVIMIWAITAAVYALIMRFSAVPRVELDANTGRARIGNLEYALSDIAHVLTTPVSNTASLTFTLRVPRRSFQPDDTVDDETVFSSADSSTPAERSRMAKIINEFLDAHRGTASLEDPYREVAGEYYVAPDQEEDAAAEMDGDEEDDAARWTRSWDAESTTNRTCFYCEKGSGESGPLPLWAKRDHQLELVFVPRCRRCRRIHDFNKRFVPAFAVLAGLIAGLMLFISRVAGELPSDLTRIGGFVVVVFGTPVAALLLGRWATSPKLFGSKDAGDWRQIPDFQQARQEGWDLRPRREDIP